MYTENKANMLPFMNIVHRYNLQLSAGHRLSERKHQQSRGHQPAAFLGISVDRTGVDGSQSRAVIVTNWKLETVPCHRSNALRQPI